MPEVRGRFKVVNRLGMHARAAAVFVQEANKYESEIRVRKGDLEASAKSIMSILQLATLAGDSIEIIARGDDCQEALRALGDVIMGRFGESE